MKVTIRAEAELDPVLLKHIKAVLILRHVDGNIAESHVFCRAHCHAGIRRTI